MAATNISLNIEKEAVAAALSHVVASLAKDFPKRSRERGEALAAGGIVHASLDGEDVHATLEDNGERHKVRLALPLYGSGITYVQCSCPKQPVVAGEPRCAHVWATYKGLEQALVLLDKETQAAPGWEGVFEAMDAFVGEDAPSATAEAPDAPAETRMAWRVVTDGGPLAVYPCMETRQGETWREDRRLPWTDTDTVAHLEELIGSSVVRLSGSDAPVEVLTGTVGLAVSPRDGGIVVASHIGGMTPIRQWIYPGRAYVTWTKGERDRIFLARCNQATTDFLRRLEALPEPLPESQKDRLLPYLVRLEQRLAVAVADSLIRAEMRPGSSRLHVRLTPMQPAGLKVELLVRPSPTGGYFPVGMGPETVLDVSDMERPGNLIRDLAAERAHGVELIAALGLDVGACFAGHIWFLRHDDAALALVSSLSSIVEREDIIVEWPKHAKRTYELAEPLAGQSLRLSVGDGRDWFGVEGKVEIGGDTIELAALIDAIRKKLRYVRLRNGKWARVTELFERRLLRLTTLLQEEQGQLGVTLASLPQLAEEGVVEQASEAWWRAHRAFRSSQTAKIALPEGFRATLRPYQLEGYQWLCRLAAWGMGACLADDMGLGKTIQALAALLHLAPRGPSLVLTPTSVSPGWAKEAGKFAPGLRPLMYRDTDRDQVLGALRPGDLVICSYGLAQRDADKLAAVDWNVLVLDEAQAIKNAHTKTARAVHALRARWRLALSGTPIENGLSELWSLFHALSPGMFGSWEAFKRSFALPIERFGYEGSREALGRRVQPYLLRRLKEDYLHELPPKTEIDITVELSVEERQLYDAVRLSAVRSLEQDKEKEAEQGMAVLAALTKLRQVACHPRLFDPDWAGGSAKLAAFLEVSRRLRESGHKALVFSQFTGHLDLLGEALTSLGASWVRIDGSTPQRRRAELVDEFQAGGAEFFLISVKAGGTGLTLTAADYVLHMDPWWNPAVEDQATDRAHRMGQMRPLTVYRFIAAGTVEDTIMQMHESKRRLVCSVLEDAIELLRS
jgi:superfamily II DNA or RNA helicase